MNLVQRGGDIHLVLYPAPHPTLCTCTSLAAKPSTSPITNSVTCLTPPGQVPCLTRRRPTAFTCTTSTPTLCHLKTDSGEKPVQVPCLTTRRPPLPVPVLVLVLLLNHPVRFLLIAAVPVFTESWFLFAPTNALYSPKCPVP